MKNVVIHNILMALFSLLGAYLAESEQRSCALAAGTAVKGILCTAAGGYLIEQATTVIDFSDDDIVILREGCGDVTPFK